MLGAIPKIDAYLVSPEPQQPILPDLPPELQQVMNVISSESLPFDMIIQQTGLATSAVASALLQLELMGLISQQPGMRYQRS
jgi:DNA processing protein